MANGLFSLVSFIVKARVDATDGSKMGAFHKDGAILLVILSTKGRFAAATFAFDQSNGFLILFDGIAIGLWLLHR